MIKKEQLIVISDLKTDMPLILGGLSNGEELMTTLTAIRTPELWNAHDGVIGMYPQASKSLGDQPIKIQSGINR